MTLFNKDIPVPTISRRVYLLIVLFSEGQAFKHESMVALSVSITAMKHHDQNESCGGTSLFRLNLILFIKKGGLAGKGRKSNRAELYRQKLIQKP